MNTLMMFDAIPTRVVALDEPFGWLLIAFAGFSIAMLVGTALASLRDRTVRSVHVHRRRDARELRAARRAVTSLAGVRRREGRPSP